MSTVRWLYVTIGAALVYLTVVVVDLATDSWQIPADAERIIQAGLCLAILLETGVWLAQLSYRKITAHIDRRLDAVTNQLAELAAAHEQTNSADLLDGYARGYADGLAREPMRGNGQLRSVER